MKRELLKGILSLGAYVLWLLPLTAIAQPAPQVGVVYVNTGSARTSAEGSLFRSYASVAEAVVAVERGGTVRLGTGIYRERLILEKPMRLKATGGRVKIGFPTLTPEAAIEKETRSEEGKRMQVAFKSGVSSPAEALPTAFSLSGNYPNPFNPATTIQYALPEEAYVRLVVYNTLGQEVAVLVNGLETAGVQEAVWDGRTQAGAPVPSGAYLYRLEAGGFVQTKSMVLLK